jgi:hypothetical protein
MHLDALSPEQRPSRKGKERDTLQRDPQPTDLDEKLMALRRRTAAPVMVEEHVANSQSAETAELAAEHDALAVGLLHLAGRKVGCLD